MGYLHIDNLYKNQAIMHFKTCYALEKIHGTSAHIRWSYAGGVQFFSGGEKHERFVALFDADALEAKFSEKFGATDEAIVVYGEAYGGKQQGMSATYGPNLKFVAFDVNIGDKWLDVPSAHRLVEGLGLEFVDYVEIPTTLEAINAERDRPSVQAIRNGITEPKLREGVVLRPPKEMTLNNGARVISKHKRDEFMETATPRKVDEAQLLVLQEADRIAEEWVTPMRLQHVLDKLGNPTDMTATKEVVRSMFEDVMREGAGEIGGDMKANNKAIGARTVKLFKEHLNSLVRQV